MFECWDTSRDNVFAFEDDLYGVHFLQSLKEARETSFSTGDQIDFRGYGGVVAFFDDMYNNTPNTATPSFKYNPRTFEIPDYYKSHEFQYSKREKVWKCIYDSFEMMGYKFPDYKTCAKFILLNLELLNRLAKLRVALTKAKSAIEGISMTVEIIPFGNPQKGKTKDVEIIVRDEFSLEVIAERVLTFVDILIYEMEKFVRLQRENEKT